MTRISAAIALTAALLLGACAAPQAQTAAGATPTASTAPTASKPVQDPIVALKQAIAKLAVPDLQAAIQVAQGVNDKPALQCYTWELSVAQALSNPGPATTGFGPITAYERVRAARISINSGNGLLADFNLNCAALVNDEVATLAKIGISVGGIAAGGPAAGILGAGLPAIGATLPIPIGPQ